MKYIEIADRDYDFLEKSAVFIPLIEKDGKDYIIFEKRAQNIPQPGEVSFPGGGVEEGESFKDAAERELKEELCLGDGDFELEGFSSSILMSNRRLVGAFYGRIYKDEGEIEYNEEVEEIFSLPLDYFIKNPPTCYKNPLKMDFAQDFPFEKIPGGKAYPFKLGSHDVYFYETEPVIRGITAKLLKDFIERYKDEK